MTASAEVDDARSGTARFDARTERCDATRAQIQVAGDLDQRSAPILARILDDHLAAGRRFLRVGVREVSHIDEAGASVLAAVHDRLLAQRGTLIVTGVPGNLRAALSGFGLGDRLFLLAPCAHELGD